MQNAVPAGEGAMAAILGLDDVAVRVGALRARFLDAFRIGRIGDATRQFRIDEEQHRVGLGDGGADPLRCRHGSQLSAGAPDGDLR